MLKRLLAEVVNRLRPLRGQNKTQHAIEPGDNETDERDLAPILAAQNSAVSCNKLGERYRDNGAGIKARACFEQAVAMDTSLVTARFNLGNLLFGANLIDGAAEQYAAILALQPNNADALNNLSMTFLQSGRADEAVRMFRNVLAEHPDFDDARSNLLLALTLAHDHPPEEMLEEHRRLANKMRPAHTITGEPQNLPDPLRRLRIGYVSGDFKNHPVAWFMSPILMHHDARCFEIYCYSNWYKSDAVTETLKQHAVGWRQINHLTDAEVANLVRSDGIDILIDLSGHTNGGRLGVFALKPAPVQMTYLGYLNTTGLSTIDYRITDAYGDPAETSDAYYVEKLLRLRACMWCYRPRESMPDVGSPPAITNGHITFGSFNNAMKINSRMTALWSQILSATPGSKLVIAGLPEGRTRDRLRAELTSGAVKDSRVELLGRLPMQEFWRLHNRVDIALDSFPYNGGTTTCDTLWMGVPVVSLCGDRFAARAGYSILANVGLHELVAQSGDQYVEIACALACDPARLENLRAGMRRRLGDAPLLDAVSFTKNLECVYRNAWQAWCTSRNP